MNYIINPSWVYWLNIVNGIDIVSAIVCAILGIMTLCGTIWYVCTLVGDADEERADWTSAKERKVLKPYLKAGWILTVLFLLVALFMPTKETLLEMQIARLATAENAEKALEAVKAAADYVVEALRSLK